MENNEVKSGEIKSRTNVDASAVQSVTKHTNSAPTLSNYQWVAELAGAMDDLKSVAGVIIKSNLCPLKKEEDVILAAITGNQLGIDFMTSIQHIFSVNGKTAMSAHLHRALLLRAKISFKKVLDYEPLYKWYYAEIIEGKLVPIKIQGAGGKEIPKEYGVYPTNFKCDDVIIRGNNAIDWATRYEFKRIFVDANGKETVQEATGEFTLLEAQTAGLTDKDNWKKYPKRMLDARAFTIGGREIGDDILNGMYTISEIAEVENVPYTISEDFEEAILDND